MKSTRTTALAAVIFLLTACTTEVSTHVPEKDLGMLWVQHAAEYQAISRQVYGLAERDLARFIADRSWTALPGQTGAEELPPAVILDVDETVINNVANWHFGLPEFCLSIL